MSARANDEKSYVANVMKSQYAGILNMPGISSRSAKDKAAASTTSRDVSLQVMVPARIKREVSLRAAKQGLTQRTIVLKALRAIGIKIDAADLFDKRKTR